MLRGLSVVQLDRVAAQVGEVLEKADELGDCLFVVISVLQGITLRW